jgi:DNA-binding NtrC family response regulator
VRQHQPGGEELPREIAKALVEAVKRQILSDIELKLMPGSRTQAGGETMPPPAGLSLFDVNDGINLYDEMRQYEIHLIRWALQLAHGKQVIAARLLGIRATTLNNKIKHYNITWQEGQ